LEQVLLALFRSNRLSQTHEKPNSTYSKPRHRQGVNSKTKNEKTVKLIFSDVSLWYNEH